MCPPITDEFSILPRSLFLSSGRFYAPASDACHAYTTRSHCVDRRELRPRFVQQVYPFHTGSEDRTRTDPTFLGRSESARRWTVADGGEGLRQHALQRTAGNHDRERPQPQACLVV